jgi:fibronectin-binding autotransporter adhesin
MARSTITGTVTQTVTLGEGGYDDRLLIKAAGFVVPSLYGAAGIVDPSDVQNAHITNDGRIYGAFGGNSGNATAGGIGVDLYAAGTLLNAGTITGGTSGYYTDYAGALGVDLRQGGDITNQGVIRGGEGAYSYFDGTQGGAGIALNGGTLINSGHVYGGRGANGIYDPGAGGAAVLASAGASITNSGTLSGGYAPSGYRYGALGGTGVQLNSASLTNIGLITGGNGGGNDAGNGAGGSRAGGAGVYLHGGALTNIGTIIGGTGGSASGSGHFGADGGAGVEITGGTLFAGGTIQGGMSGVGYRAAGGAGISVLGGDVTVTGTITGGYNNGNTLSAVTFGSQAGTLTIDPGAVFNGTVAANATDLLVLGGTDTATLSGLGTQFTDFGTVQVAAGAIWVLDGSNALSADLTVQLSATLSVMGRLTESRSVTLAAGSILNAGTSGAILARDVTLQGGRLDESAGSRLAVGSSLTSDTDGTLLVERHATVAGEGIISADAISVAGTVSAQGGTLTLHGGTSGTGTVAIASGATLVADGALSVTNLDFTGAGATLVLMTPTDVTSSLSGFGTGDVVDLEKLVATTLTYAGGTLTLLNGTQIVDTLSLTGSYTATDFTLQSDGSQGTDLLYAGTQAPENGNSAVQDLQITRPGYDGPGAGFIGCWHGGDDRAPTWLSAGLFVHGPG